jgi:hypothetical protein
MKSVSFKICFSVIVAVIFLPGCGKSLSESERAYADTCVKKIMGEAYRKRCECEARIVVPKLTPGELKSYVAEWPKGPMNSDALSKFAAEHGFTLDEMSSVGPKMQSLFPEISKTCAGK